MECPQCHTGNPDVARFCFRCGQSLVTGVDRKDAYAANPNEPVASFNLISTIMPQGAGARPQTYRTALIVALAFPVIGAALGLLSFAIVTAAFAIPVVYIVYIYDVNLWEDQPVNVVVMAFVFTGMLALMFTLLWREALFSNDLATPLRAFVQVPRLKEILILCLLVPIVSEVLKQIGPIFLASRPAFDDLIDGLTFGVVAGVSFAAFETLILYRSIIVDASVRSGGTNTAVWVSIVITAGLIKPIVYGTATGIAVAEFSGLGDKYDGFTPRYARGLAEAVIANIAYQLGVYLFSVYVEGTSGALLGMLWGILVAGALIIRVRTVLHTGLLEAALEDAVRDNHPKHETREIGFCSQCEMPLLDHSMFCIACGTSVRCCRASG